MPEQDDGISIGVTRGRPGPRALKEAGSLIGHRAGTAELIAEDLRQQIARGDLLEGVRLPTERDLARHFDVSGPTVREALRILATMGLVNVRHGSGTYVAVRSHRFLGRSLETFLQLENVGLEEILFVRLGLREQIVRAAIMKATDADLDSTEEAQRKLESVIPGASMEERTTAYLEMLETMSSLSHNPLLRALDTFLNSLIFAFERIVYSDKPEEFWIDWMTDSRADRARIVEAVRARDEQAAIAAVHRYNARSRRRLMNEPLISSISMADTRIIDGMAERWR